MKTRQASYAIINKQQHILTTSPRPNSKTRFRHIVFWIRAHHTVLPTTVHSVVEKIQSRWHTRQMQILTRWRISYLLIGRKVVQEYWIRRSDQNRIVQAVLCAQYLDRRSLSKPYLHNKSLGQKQISINCYLNWYKYLLSHRRNSSAKENVTKYLTKPVVICITQIIRHR